MGRCQCRAISKALVAHPFILLEKKLTCIADINWLWVCSPVSNKLPGILQLGVKLEIWNSAIIDTIMPPIPNYVTRTRDSLFKGPAKRIQHHPTLLNPTLLDDVAQCSTRWPNECNMLDSTLDLSPVRFRSLHKPALSFPWRDTPYKIRPTDMVFLPVVR